MNKHRILQAGRLLPSLEAKLAAEFDTVLLAEQGDPAAFLAAHGAGFEGFVTSAGVGVTADMLAQLPGCVRSPASASGWTSWISPPPRRAASPSAIRPTC